MSGSIDYMTKKLRPLGLYDLSNSSLVYKELLSYSAALDEAEGLISQLENECFVQTALSYGLKNREEIWGVERTDLSAEQRRSMIMNRMSIAKDSFTPEDMNNFLTVLNFNGSIEEFPGLSEIMITNNGASHSKAERAWIKEQILSFFPAHLQIFVDFRVKDWDWLDNKSLTFSQMDGKNFTWEDIENYGV